MRRAILGLVLATVVTLAGAVPAAADPKPEFKLGFRALAEQIPAVVGDSMENEHRGANGDSLQQTTTGLMVWRKVTVRRSTGLPDGHAAFRLKGTPIRRYE